MKRLLILAFVAIATACSPVQKAVREVAADPYNNENRYVIILSMDAFRWDLAAHANTPTLDSLRRVGTYAETYPVYPSNTFPNHYSMATGLHPDDHGVVNNNFYDKVLGRELSVFKLADTSTPNFWGGDPIWNTVERQGRVANIFMWPGSEVPIGGRQATVWTPYSDDPSYYERADWVIEAMTRPVEQIPNLVMWYFEQPDAAMHRHGPLSEQAVAQAERIDSTLRYFFWKIRQSPVYDKINFIVTADHGMADLSDDRIANLYEVLDPQRVVRTVSGRPYGVEVEAGYEEEALQALNKVKGIKAFKREELPAKYHYGKHSTRITNLVVMPDMDWTVEYRKPEVERRPIGKGAHGFDCFEREMSMVFYGTGPAFRKGYEQHSFQNLNMYIILCHLLGVEPSENDGDWSAVRKMFVK